MIFGDKIFDCQQNGHVRMDCFTHIYYGPLPDRP